MRPEPKFSVGEAVMIRSKYKPEFNANHAVIMSVNFYNRCKCMNTGIITSGWIYKTNKDPNQYGWGVESLRPIPREKLNGICALEWIKDLRAVEA